MSHPGLILMHALTGVTGALFALWTLIELANASENNISRIKLGSILTTIFIWLSYFFGGWFYIYYYGADKTIIKDSDYYWGHAFFTEVKEHWFFLALIASLYLPIVVYGNDINKNTHARKLGMAISGIVFLVAFAMEGFGAFIAMALRMASGF